MKWIVPWRDGDEEDIFELVKERLKREKKHLFEKYDVEYVDTICGPDLDRFEFRVIKK